MPLTLEPVVLDPKIDIESPENRVLRILAARQMEHEMDFVRTRLEQWARPLSLKAYIAPLTDADLALRIDTMFTMFQPHSVDAYKND